MPPQPKSSAGFSVLVADDLAEIRDLVSAWLTRRGFRVVGAASGNAALALLQRMHFDLVVADVFMPDGNGLDVIRGLKGKPGAPPVLAISGGGGKLNAVASIMRADDCGAAAVLRKPFNEEHFFAAVERILRRNPP